MMSADIMRDGSRRRAAPMLETIATPASAAENINAAFEAIESIASTTILPSAGFPDNG